jgi:HAE1 family hydrophobic/amphiphilic exporter-1
MAKVLRQSPIVAMVISIITGHARRGGDAGPADRAVPESRSADHPGHDHVHRRQRHGRGSSVATPLEQQINGVENMIYMKSTNANDGTLTLKVSFEVGSNLDMNNVLTQNRVSQGHAPDAAVGEELRRVVKKALAFPLLVISVKSPNGTYDSSFLSKLHDDQHQRRHRAHSRA